MQIALTGRKIEVTQALKNFAEEKVSKIKKIYDYPFDVHMVLSVEKYRHQAEVSINANGIFIHSKEETGNMYQSIDKVIGKVERQLKKYKEKIRAVKNRQENKWTGVKANTIDRDSIFQEGEKPKIMKTKDFDVKPMSLKEAIMQIDLIGSDSLVFVNSSNNEVNVVYRRKDGNYDLIEPF